MTGFLRGVMKPIDAETARVVAESLPDDPFTFGTRCLLFRGTGEAWLSGPPSRFHATVVRDPWQPNEPTVWGSEPAVIWELLREIPGWDCVNCSRELAPAIQELVEGELATSARVMDDIYFVLERPAPTFGHPHVRRLSEDDLEMVERAPSALHPPGYDSTLAALSGGIVVGVIADRELVGTVSMTASSETFANLGAYLLAGWRGRGLGTVAAALAAREVQSRCLQPVWSTGEENEPSQRLARKIGFQEYGRRAYVIVPELQRTGGYRPGTSVSRPSVRAQ